MITASQILGAIPSSESHWRVSEEGPPGYGPYANVSSQAPSPPHIHIPPASEDKGMVLPPYSNFANGASEEDQAILKVITQGHYSVKPKEWKYESRRQAQSILAFLYLGPSSATRDLKFLREQGVTMLLVIRDTNTATSGLLSGRKAAKELGIISECIDVRGNQELIRAFPRAIDIINNHLVQAYRAMKDPAQPPATSNPPNAWGKVLVWCESGNERSATVVAAYLMAMYKLNLVGAIQYIQAQRFCVAFDDGLKHLLFSYHQILEARQGVSEVHNLQEAALANSVGKRSRDEVDYDMDLDTATFDDLERFGGRNFAPFS